MSTESDLQLHRDVGRIEGDVKSVEKSLADFKDSVNQQLSDMQTKVDQMHAIVLRADGGLRTMLVVGSIGASLGGFVAWAVEHLPRWMGRQ